MPIDFNLIKTLAGHKRDVNAVAFSRDDRLLASGGGDRAVIIWDVAAQTEAQSFDHGEWVNDVAFAPSGQLVASAARDGSLKVWNIEAGKLLGSVQAHPQNATCLTFSPDGSWLVSGGAEGAIRVFNLKTTKIEGSVTAHSGWVWRVFFSPAGDRIVSAGADKVTRVWKMGTNEKPLALLGHEDEVLYASFSPDGRLIATGSKDGTIRVWDSATGRQNSVVEAHEGAVNAVNFSPDGEYVVTAGADHLVRVWEVATGERARELVAGYDYMADAIFSHDGKRMATCGGDGAVKIWEVTEKAAYASAPAVELEFELEKAPSSVGYSSSYAAGKSLAQCTLKSGLKVSLLQATADKHSLALGEPARTAVSVAGAELTVFNGQGVPQFKLDLATQSVTYDRTEGSAAPWNGDGDLPSPLRAESEPQPAPVAAAAGPGAEFELELSSTPAPNRYQAFEKLGEVVLRERTQSGRLIRLVRFDGDTLYLLFDEREEPTVIVRSDFLDVRDSSKQAVFRLSARSMEPVISRRGNGAEEEPETQEAARDPLIVFGSEEVVVAPRLHRLLSNAVWAKASDIHIPSGAPLLVRKDGRLQPMDDRVYKASEIEEMLLELLTDDQRQRFEEDHQLDFSYQIAGVGRFRANLCRQHRGVDGSFRVIPEVIPTPEALGVPASVLPLRNNHQGLVLVTGPAGQGKSTTISTLVDMINSEKPLHVITVEDPIEFVHPIKRAVVNQREVGKHTLSFANALRAALREDPDVIVVGEMRDLETISLAVTAAETGHLVFGTLMTINASQTIDRILDSFPSGQQAQIRTMLSESLKGIVSQQLVPEAGGTGRVLACEVLLCNLAVANMIRERKTFQLNSVMQTSRNVGMQRMDDSLADLMEAGRITAETAMMYAHDAKAMEARAKSRRTNEPAAPLRVR